jgi:hypothetical protein
MEVDFENISDSLPSGVGDVLKKEGFDNAASLLHCSLIKGTLSHVLC